MSDPTQHGRLPPNARFQISSQQVFTQVNGAALILSFSTNQYYSLDEIGSWIWKALHQPLTLHDLHQLTCATFEVDAERCLADVSALLESLLTEKLIIVCP